jgi:hypothetical protein
VKKKPVMPQFSSSRLAARSSRLLAAAIAANLCVPAFAVEGVAVDEDAGRMLDALNPYLSVGYGYDSNIYRLDEDAPEIGERADQYGMVSAGFDADLRPSQQRFELYGEVNHTFFNEHDDLDYTGSKAGALWHWVLTRPMNGTVGVTHRRALRDFANQPTIDKVKDLRMENKLLANGNFDLPGPWQMGLRGDFADVSFSETERLDLQRSTIGASAGFTSSAGSVIGVDAEFIWGDYDNNPLADYEEYTVGPTFEWKFTERTILNARVGYTKRDQSDPLRQDYDGVTGRVVFNMNNEERNGLKLTVYRDLSNLGDEVAEFAEVNGVEFEPRWHIRESVDLRLLVGYENRDFNRDPDLEPDPLIDPDREDDVVTGGAFLDWQMTRNFKLSLGADMQKRDSTRDLQDFDFGRAEIRITGSL